jgi:protein involved in polysaccharide export with SLBB domain
VKTFLAILLAAAAVLSAAEPTSTAAWASVYRLGPGDIIDIRFYGRSELDRELITVAPDGSITYLGVTGFPVAGKTIEETRHSLEAALSEFYKSPRLVLIPRTLASKSYTLMGMVKTSGIFPLDTPLTLLEAIARAGGTTSGLFDRRYVDLADLGRSFLLRGQRRLPVDFQRLMLHGDMTQNVPLEPGDYIHIASALANDYFVLGAVRNPGREGFTENATVLSAIAKRGGYQPNAFRERVLIVRGSLSTPEVKVVNTDAVLKGNAQDVALQPKDIVYISSRPWYMAEEIADAAVIAFLQSSVATWTGLNMPVIFREAVLPATPQGQVEIEKLAP